MINPSTLRRSLFGGCVAIALFAGAAVLTTPGVSVGQGGVDVGQGQAQAGPEAQVRVGTFEPEQVFDLYHGRQAFMQQFQELQMEAQQAQQEGDQEQLMQIQQRAQQAQEQLFEQFHSDVEAAAPNVADEANLQIVAENVVYSGDGIESEDVTQQLIEKLNEGHEQPEPVVPEMGVGQ